LSDSSPLPRNRTDMAGDAVLREVTLALPMVPEIEIEASKTATAVAESMKMSPDRIDEVRMAVVEACINAIEHSQSREREVYVTFEVLGEKDPEKLRITVRDTGVGFEPERMDDPRIEDKLKARRKRGWGLKIIRGLMDEVEIHSGAEGTIVVMSKLR
jgi:serine/threonine-protein kinase RsbW